MKKTNKYCKIDLLTDRLKPTVIRNQNVKIKSMVWVKNNKSIEDKDKTERGTYNVQPLEIPIEI